MKEFSTYENQDLIYVNELETWALICPDSIIKTIKKINQNQDLGIPLMGSYGTDQQGPVFSRICFGITDLRLNRKTSWIQGNIQFSDNTLGKLAEEDFLNNNWSFEYCLHLLEGTSRYKRKYLLENIIHLNMTDVPESEAKRKTVINKIKAHV